MAEGQQDAAILAGPTCRDEVCGVVLERLALRDPQESHHDLDPATIRGTLVVSDEGAEPFSWHVESPVAERRVAELVSEHDEKSVSREVFRANEDPVVAAQVGRGDRWSEP